jgi:methylated-DNA-[protein]-cysteine S-methyltransferase
MLTTYVIAHIETPIGFLAIQGNEKGIASITFLDDHPGKIEEHDYLAECTDQLKQYFDGKRKLFDSIALHYCATDFQKSVWDSLMDVPFGEVITYGELAQRAGHEGAARAVGTAMNVNPLPIIIPCHRVLPSDRSLGQYASGPGRKMWLLQHETVQ